MRARKTGSGGRLHFGIVAGLNRNSHLDDFSRFIVAWKLCTTMKAEDVTDTLDLASKASGLSQAKVVHRPRLLSDNGSSYISAHLAKWLTRALKI